MNIAVLLLFAALLVAATPGNDPPHYSDADLADLRKRVKNMFYHTWDAYLAHGFPADELMPLSCAGRTKKTRGFMDDTLGFYSLQVVDALDTFAVLGEWTDFEFYTDWLIKNFSFKKTQVVSVFEMCIRVLGGLISGHMIAQRHALENPSWRYRGGLLDLAVMVGDNMLVAFDTPTGIPVTRINIAKKKAVHDSNVTTVAEATTLLLEMGVLSELTGNPVYKQVADRALDAVWNARSEHDLVGTSINVTDGSWTNPEGGIGPGIDSFYEYLLKSFLVFGDESYLDMYNAAKWAILARGRVGFEMLPVEIVNGTILGKRTHTNLEMFWPGVLVLDDEIELALTFYAFYATIVGTATFPPEAFKLVRGNNIVSIDAGYVLRPEFIESTLYLYRATGMEDFLLIADKTVSALEKHCRVSCGYAAVGNLNYMELQDRLDTFFLSELIKYLYLLFDPTNRFNCGDIVFTTEAHPFFISELEPLSKKSQYVQAPHVITDLTPGMKVALHSIRHSAEVMMLREPNDFPSAEVIFYSRYGTLKANASMGDFGPRLEVGEKLGGRATVPRPLNGCANTTVFDHKDGIGLIQRGGCMFEDKVVKAQHEGCRAAIIFDNVPRTLMTMTTNPNLTEHAAIPSFFMSRGTGETVLEWLRYTDYVYISITHPVHQ